VTIHNAPEAIKSVSEGFRRAMFDLSKAAGIEKPKKNATKAAKKIDCVIAGTRESKNPCNVSGSAAISICVPQRWFVGIPQIEPR
jgi:hypothetical protein